MANFHSPVKVSFFQTSSVKTFSRHLMVNAASFDSLCGNILQNMQPDEHFACFRKETGQVIALDKYGHFVSL